MNERATSKDQRGIRKFVNITKLASLVRDLYTINQRTYDYSLNGKSHIQTWAMRGEVRIEQFEMQCNISPHYTLFGSVQEFRLISPGFIALICDCCTLHSAQIDFLLSLPKTKTKGGTQ